MKSMIEDSSYNIRDELTENRKNLTVKYRQFFCVPHRNNILWMSLLFKLMTLILNATCKARLSRWNPLKANSAPTIPHLHHKIIKCIRLLDINKARQAQVWKILSQTRILLSRRGIKIKGIKRLFLKIQYKRKAIPM